MNKLAVIVPIYKRHELTNLCLKNLWNQWNKYGIDVFVVGSEGQASRDLAENFGFNYLEFENNPLSDKLNAILKEAKGYDGVIVLGSDNFISDSIIEYYQTVDCSTSAVYGFDDIHFYSTSLKKLATKSSYNSMKMSIGVGRLFTKELLKVANYSLWNESLNSGLDTSSNKRISALGAKHEIIPYTKDFFMLDIKHELNISDPAIIKTCRLNCELTLMEKHLPHVCNDILKLNSNSNQIITRMKTLKVNPIKKQISTVKIEIIKSVAGMQVGETRSVDKNIASKAVQNGWARVVEAKKEVIFSEPVKVEDPKEEAAKKIEPKKSFSEKLEKSLEKKATPKTKTVKKSTKK